MSEIEARREVFNRVKAHLLTQNAQALDYCGGCAYRGQDGTKCAVGCLITDNAYSPGIEGATALDERLEWALGQSGVPTDMRTLRMLDALQRMHDGRSPGYWPDELDRIEALFLGPEES